MRRTLTIHRLKETVVSPLGSPMNFTADVVVDVVPLAAGEVAVVRKVAC